MRDHTNRDVIYYDIVIKSSPEHAPVKSIEFFLQGFYNLFQSGKTFYWTNKQKIKTYIKQIEINEKEEHAVILLYYVDSNARGASYAHLDHDTQRDEELEEREGRPESVHILISLKNSGNEDKPRHLAIIEESSKINRQRIENFLNNLIREVKRQTNNRDFRAPSPDGAKENGKPTQYTYTNIFQLQGHISQDFHKMLKEGKLSGISLEADATHEAGFGEQSYVRPKKKEIMLTPISGKWSERATDRLREALHLGKSNSYEKARVVFQAQDGKPHVARIDTETNLVVGESFVKKKRLGKFESLLLDADVEINDHIKSKMIELLSEK